MGRYVLEDVESHDSPFPHYLIGCVFEPAVADELLGWLETAAPWELREGAFYEQYGCDLLASPPSARCASLFEQPALDQLRAAAEMLFRTRLRRRVSVVAHKLVSGQGIGLHNDDPQGRFDRETHRFVAQLNRGWEIDNGGYLLLFRSDNPFDVALTFRPSHNHAVGFPLSRQSYHAVSEIRSGARYSIVYSFWEDPWRSGLGFDEVERLFSVLQGMSTEPLPQSSATLHQHLLGSCRLLDRWGCPPFVLKAGLFSCAYGNEACPTSLAPAHDRDLLRRLIGSDAGELVHLYRATSIPALISAAAQGPPFTLLSRRDQTAISVTRTQLSQMLTLGLAVTLERLPRAPDDCLQTREAVGLFLRASPLLPTDAVIELRWVLEARHRTGSRPVFSGEK